MLLVENETGDVADAESEFPLATDNKLPAACVTTTGRVFPTAVRSRPPPPPSRVCAAITRNQLKDDHICSQPQERRRSQILDYIAGDMVYREVTATGYKKLGSESFS